MKIGYARKSTKEQDTSLEYQIEALQKAGCENGTRSRYRGAAASA